MTSFHPDDAQQDENENVRPARAVRSTTRILDSEKLVEHMRGLPRTSPHGGPGCPSRATDPYPSQSRVPQGVTSQRLPLLA